MELNAYDIAGLFMIRTDADNWSDESYRDNIYAMVDAGVGGIGIFVGSLADTAQMIADIKQRARGRHLLFAADYEHGLKMRHHDAVAFPRAMALGRTHADITRHIANSIAEQARALGVTWNFAPVADINSNPRNPIINTRAYGDDAKTVGAHVQAYVKGLQEKGVLACAKHAPGHGDTQVDSHVSMPTFTASEEQARSREYLPFLDAIHAGVETIMVSHIKIPYLDNDHPASLSPAVVTDLIRTEWGFKGLVATDALDMHSITNNYTSAEAAVLAIGAGVDMLILPENFDEARQGIYDAVLNHTITEDRVRQALAKIEAAKRFTLSFGAVDQPDTNAHAMMALQAAFTALNVRGDSSILPIVGKHVAAFAIVVNEDSADTETTFLHYLANSTESNCDYAFINNQISADDVRDLAAGVVDAEVVVFAFFQRAIAFGNGLVDASNLVHAMKELSAGRPSIIVSCGSPYGLDELESTLTIHAYSDTLPSLAATVMHLSGRTPLS